MTPGKKPSILITAGPTREKIDPVRYISNYSTGTFGYAIAKEAARRGWAVTLISGPTQIKRPKAEKFIEIESAFDLRRAVMKEFRNNEIIVMAAAVSDWRVASPLKRKIKRSGTKRYVELLENPDILKEMGQKKRGKILVGFALETENLPYNALKKLKSKNLDLIIANAISKSSGAFGSGITDVLMIDKFGNKKAFYRKPKPYLAKIILDKAKSLNI